MAKNYNRLKSNILNRDWSSKSTKTNINYIKSKLKQFGLSIPKYLQQGKITDKQIGIQSKRIVGAIEQQQQISRNIAKQQNAINRQLFDKVKTAEKSFVKSFNNASPLEREVFLGNKTANFLDSIKVGSPLYYHNFKSFKEFDNHIKKLSREFGHEDAMQYVKDYMNNLNVNHYENINPRLTETFNKRVSSFYNVGGLKDNDLRNHKRLTQLFQGVDYIRQQEMIEIMDTSEYAQMVESLVKKGYSEPLAMEIALMNLGFRSDGDYNITD